MDLTSTWHATELEPFRRLVAANNADCVMVANSFNGQIDASYPATLSVKTVQGRLRGDYWGQDYVIPDPRAQEAFEIAPTIRIYRRKE